MRAYHHARVARARLQRGPAEWNGVRILCYHRISAEDAEPLAVPPDRFREQMELVLASGATPIRLSDALPLLERPVDGRYVCVTFDDGYRDNLEHAEPVLRALGIPATVYLPTAIVDGTATYDWYERPPAALSWDDVTEVVSGGVLDVQSHSRNHRWLPRLDPAAAEDEITGSKLDVELRVPYAVTSFCYPAGLYGPREIELVRKAGYRAAVTSDPGVNKGGEPLETLRRTMVYWEDSRRDFQLKLDGRLDAPPAVRKIVYGLRSGGRNRFGSNAVQ
jgi:peptidoglycan/xylan/chitin deacetylase (PgdA/CDA1 family)